MAITTAINEPRSTPRRKPFYKDMSAQVFVGMAIGALIGWAWPQSADWMRTLGDLFIRLISVFVGLIIFCTVVHGVATVREARRVGRIGKRGKTRGIGMIIRFPRRHESDSLRACRRPTISTACRTPN